MLAVWWKLPKIMLAAMVTMCALWSARRVTFASSGDRIKLSHRGCGFDCIFLQTVLLERNVNLPKFRHFNANEIFSSQRNN